MARLCFEDWAGQLQHQHSFYMLFQHARVEFRFPSQSKFVFFNTVVNHSVCFNKMLYIIGVCVVFYNGLGRVRAAPQQRLPYRSSAHGIAATRNAPEQRASHRSSAHRTAAARTAPQ